ncbi:PadR family transcriptional regulator [bacterium 210820-DFI.6.37]|nr:PadR family transcriptional regulator [bacterium 210820-DFI.6.37]
MMYFEMDCPCKGKNLDKMLQPAILLELFDTNLYGFTLIRKLSQNSMFDGNLPDKAGVYRYLKKMEASGLLKSDWEIDDDGGKPRRVYFITDQGKDCLANWAVALKAYIKSVEVLVEKIDKKVGTVS